MDNEWITNRMTNTHTQTLNHIILLISALLCTWKSYLIFFNANDETHCRCGDT